MTKMDSPYPVSPPAGNIPDSGKPSSCVRKKWPLRYGLPFLLLIFAANHLEYHFRQKHTEIHGVSDVVVRTENDILSGHTSIGIEENTLKSDVSSLLHFVTLAQWNYDQKAPSPPPEQIQKFNGQTVSCLGFIYPLEPGTMLKSFCLLRTTQTCCYGPRPQYNQYILVEMKSPVKFERLKPVIVQGRFFVDPQPSQGYIFRMEGESSTSVSDDGPDANPADESRKTGIPLFDFASIAALEDSNTKELPSSLLAMDNNTFLVAGYFLNRVEGKNPQLLIGCKYWDGKIQGSPPTIYNTAIAFPEPGQMPALWKEKGIMKGILHVEKDPGLWRQKGIISLEKTVSVGAKGASLMVNHGPYLEPWHEALILVAFIYFIFRRKRSSEEILNKINTGDKNGN